MEHYGWAIALAVGLAASAFCGAVAWETQSTHRLNETVVEACAHREDRRVCIADFEEGLEG